MDRIDKIFDMAKKHNDKMEEISDRILFVIDRYHGAFFDEFVEEMPDINKKDISNVLNKLITNGIVRQKEDEIEHDWEYIRR